MNIVVLSGKGGTGKTTLSTNLSLLLKANYIDCDVEEPNGFIFLEPGNLHIKNVEVEIPKINKDKCNLCGACVKSCQFNALAKGQDKIILFEKLCHSCGTCGLVCPRDAIDFVKRPTGIIEEGFKGDILLKRGILNIGEPMAVPVLKKLLEDLPADKINILDSPPGTSCNVVNVLGHGDYAILVTEPTAFGLHDLKMAVELVNNLNIPYGLIINKLDGGNKFLDEYIGSENINLLGTIPYSRNVAEHYSRGETLLKIEEIQGPLLNIVKNLKEGIL